MTNFKFTIQYEGSRYDGWQRQKNTANTIQGKLEHVLGEMAGHKVEIHGAGRTDAGVHAHAQVAHSKLNITATAKEIRDYCNRFLPADIAVICCKEADNRFHARLNAQGKRYIYRLWVGETPNVFERKYLCPWKTPLDIKRMQSSAPQLLGTHDFRAFSSMKRIKKSTIRTLTRLDSIRQGNEIRIILEGNGFLYHMARIIVGTLVEIGQGKPDTIANILQSGDRTKAGPTMPPQGLILDEVFYED